MLFGRVLYKLAESTKGEGDVGARYLINRYSEAVVEVPLTGTAALTDVDTPEALEAVRAGLEGT